MNGVSVFAANNVVDNVCCRDYARTDTSIAYTHGARTPPPPKKNRGRQPTTPQRHSLYVFDLCPVETNLDESSVQRHPRTAPRCLDRCANKQHNIRAGTATMH